MILVFAGTRDGRDWVLEQLARGASVVVSTATEYGASLYPRHERLTVVYGRKNREEMERFLKEIDPDIVVDWTHPYAVEVSRNLQDACVRLSIPCERMERPEVASLTDMPGLHFFESYEELILHLEATTGNILWTIGSNALHCVLTPSLLSRSYVRVLPTSDVLEKCEALGLNAGNILGLQGPFSSEMNRVFYRDYNVKHLVTKDSGATGGTLEKIQPALDLGLQVLVFRRPSIHLD